jgi:hypothetical protein
MVDASVQVEDDFDDVDFFSAPRIEEDLDSDSCSLVGDRTALSSPRSPSRVASLDGPRTPPIVTKSHSRKSPLCDWLTKDTDMNSLPTTEHCSTHGDSESNTAAQRKIRLKSGESEEVVTIRDDDYWLSIATSGPSDEPQEKNTDITTIEVSKEVVSIRVETRRTCASKKSLQFPSCPSPRALLPLSSPRGLPQTPRNRLVAGVLGPSPSSGFWKGSFLSRGSLTRFGCLRSLSCVLRSLIFWLAPPVNKFVFDVCLCVCRAVSCNLQYVDRSGRVFRQQDQ